MKKLLTTAFLASGIGLSAFPSSINFTIGKTYGSYCNDLKVHNVYNLTQQEINRITSGECPDVAIEFTKNSVIPLNIFLRGDLLSLMENKQQAIAQVQVNQTFYVRCVENEFVFSFNLAEWKPLLEFVTGTASVMLGTENGQVFVTVGAETTVRPS